MELFWKRRIVGLLGRHSASYFHTHHATDARLIEGTLIMSLSAKIAPHLPFLRRFARAVSGSQSSGDALVAAVLEAIIADISIFPEASNERIALYRLFAKLFTSISIRVPYEAPTSAWEQRDNYAAPGVSFVPHGLQTLDDSAN